ncbi:MAG: hypothetical protein EAZ07_01550 [Cytophagales bacterium]|nr:MAG: hypothetical protein EAZ07_01550 [Cytophagales bacterium]
MNIKTLDKEIFEIITQKNKLSKLSYDHKDYDDLEEELHDLEDDFLEKYGEYFEDVLDNVHNKFCPDTDVLLPIAYLAKEYKNTGKNPDGTPILDVNFKDGVWVDLDKYPNKDTRLVLVPFPTRLLLTIDGKGKEIVWNATESK